MTLTDAQRDAIASKVASIHLAYGAGSREAACSIAAINLALTGELTDRKRHDPTAPLRRLIFTEKE